MRRGFALLTLAFVALPTVPASALASNSDDVEGTASAKEKEAKPKKVCRKVQITGLRTGARQCKTQEQWDAEANGSATDQDVRMKTGQINPG